MVNDAPRFDLADAARIARDAYAIDAVAEPLPSERDQNFLLTDAAGNRRVLKIANAGEQRDLLSAQQAAMAHIAGRFPICPRPLAPTTGGLMTSVRGADGREHIVWSVSYLPARPLGTLRRRAPALLEQFGRTVASLGSALADFDHPAIHRDFYWDLANARRVIAQHRALVSDHALGTAIDTIVDRFDRCVGPVLSRLPRRAVHGDLNDYNVLVSGEPTSAQGVEVTGVVDFGDMVFSYGVADLAIAAAYMMLDAEDPLDVCATLVRGHAAVAPLDENELQALFGLSALRLSASACIAAHQRRQRPDNEYLDVSQAAIGRTLPRLASISFELAEVVLRDASGLEPARNGARVRSWLAAHAAELAAVMPFDFATEPALVLDLSIASPLVSAESAENAEPRLTERVDEAMRAAGVRVSIGRYDEPRLLYSSPLFGGGELPLAPRRTIHLGLDIFADAGTSVFAPMRGTVHAFADNRAFVNSAASPD